MPTRLRFILLTLWGLAIGQGAAAQNWMEQDLTRRVALWLRVQDGNWDPQPCAFGDEELETAVFKTSFSPITLPGCKAAHVYRVVVDPHTLVRNGEILALMDCSHVPYRQVTLAVAIDSTHKVEFKGGQAKPVTSQAKVMVISGPIFTDTQQHWASPGITPTERAQARLYYLDPGDISPGKSTRAYTAFRAHSNALHKEVEIRFDKQDPDRFAIYVLGAGGACIKEWDDAGEE